MPIIVMLLSVPIVAAGAVVQATPRARAAFGTAATLLAFAIVSASVALGVPLDARAEGGALAALPPVVAGVSGALVFAALAMTALAALQTARRGSRGQRMPEPVARGTPLPTPASSDRRDAGVVLAGALGVAIGPHLAVVAAGALAAAIAAHFIARRWNTVGPVPLLPLLVAAGLGVLLRYAAIIAGEVGLGMDTLADVPFSPRASQLLAPALALAAAGFFGLVPIRRALPGPALSLIGIALLLRVGHVALADGLADWATVLVPIGVAAVGYAAFARRPAIAAAGGAWLGAATVGGGGGAGAVWLGAAAALLALLEGSRSLQMPHPVARMAAAALSGWGGALVLDTLLREQVAYAVLAWLAVLAVVWRMPLGNALDRAPARAASH